MIVIIDYGMGNLKSIQSKLEMLKHPSLISSKAEDIQTATHLILPGVGHFSEGMRHLREYGLLDVLENKVIDQKTPILGICLGMQLLTRHSEEGDVEGIKWIDAETRRFDVSRMKTALPVPHVGWDTVTRTQPCALFRDIPDTERYYFTHSYAVSCQHEQDVAGVTDYGYPFVSVIAKDNIYGTQFHPEKSHKHGLRMMDNFIRYA